MFDRQLRHALSPVLDRAGARLSDAGVRPLAVTGAGFAAGLGACLAVVAHAWTWALLLWLANRALDGLDGPVARHRGATELGGFLDIVADFTIYVGFVLAVAIAEPGARLACLALVSAYCVSGTSFLALSSLLERRGWSLTDHASRFADGRSLRFVDGLAEGTETVAVYVLFCLFPAHAAIIAWVFTAAVALTAVQRVALGVRLLRRPTPDPTSWTPASPSPRKAPDPSERS